MHLTPLSILPRVFSIENQVAQTHIRKKRQMFCGCEGFGAEIHEVNEVVVRATRETKLLEVARPTKFELSSNGKRIEIMVKTGFDIKPCGVPDFFWEALGVSVSDCRGLLVATLLNALYTIKPFDSRAENDMVIWKFMDEIGIGLLGRVQFMTGLRWFGAGGYNADRSDEAKLIQIRETLQGSNPLHK